MPSSWTAWAVQVGDYWRNGEGPSHAVINFQRGGHVFGDLDTHDIIARNICGGAQAIVVAVDYRLAPEHRFPSAVDDAWAAYLWVRDKGASFGVDVSRLAVAGDSAGANLAAVVALLARDAGHTDLRMQDRKST